MPGRDPRCSVCKHPKRDDVDALLLSGTRPADVFRDLTDGLGLSRASTFRHAARHLPTVGGPRWVDGETSLGDVILDLAQLRRDLLADREEYRRRGNATAANVAAQRIESVSQTLLRNGAEDEDGATDAYALSMVGAGLASVAADHPDALRGVAMHIRGLDVRDELRETRDALANTILTFIPEPTTKE